MEYRILPHGGEKIGVIGVNGCGKSSLFRMLCHGVGLPGGTEPTAGEVYLAKGRTVGILTQEGAFAEDGEDGNGDYLQNINPDSLKIIDGCLLEGGLRDAKPGDTFQFMRQGYFCVDKDSTPGNLIINRTVALNSSWDKKKK